MAGSVLFAATVASQFVLQATVVRVVDGDTLVVDIPVWKNTPFRQIDARIAGIDTPESHMPPGKCAKEVAKGQAASVFAKRMAKAGDAVVLNYVGKDKYFRIDVSVKLPNGRDWGNEMIAGGFARAYFGGTKSDWCK